MGQVGRLNFPIRLTAMQIVANRQPWTESIAVSVICMFELCQLLEMRSRRQLLTKTISPTPTPAAAMIVVLWLLWLVWLAVKFVGWILGALLFALWWMQVSRGLPMLSSEAQTPGPANLATANQTPHSRPTVHPILTLDVS